MPFVLDVPILMGFANRRVRPNIEVTIPPSRRRPAQSNVDRRRWIAPAVLRGDVCCAASRPAARTGLSGSTTAIVRLVQSSTAESCRDSACGGAAMEEDAMVMVASGRISKLTAGAPARGLTVMCATAAAAASAARGGATSVNQSGR